MAIEHKIKTRGSDSEIPKLDPFEKRWKGGTDKLHKPSSAINL